MLRFITLSKKLVLLETAVRQTDNSLGIPVRQWWTTILHHGLILYKPKMGLLYEETDVTCSPVPCPQMYLRRMTLLLLYLLMSPTTPLAILPQRHQNVLFGQLGHHNDSSKKWTKFTVAMCICTDELLCYILNFWILVLSIVISTFPNWLLTEVQKYYFANFTFHCKRGRCYK